MLTRFLASKKIPGFFVVADSDGSLDVSTSHPWGVNDGIVDVCANAFDVASPKFLGSERSRKFAEIVCNVTEAAAKAMKLEPERYCYRGIPVAHPQATPSQLDAYREVFQHCLEELSREGKNGWAVFGTRERCHLVISSNPDEFLKEFEKVFVKVQSAADPRLMRLLEKRILESAREV